MSPATWPGSITPGQSAAAQTRTPPSVIVALAAAEDALAEAGTRWGVVRHGPVVGHGNDERVLGNAELVQGLSQRFDVGLDHTLVALADQAALERGLLRVRNERHPQWPPGHVEGLLRFGVAADEVERPIARFDIEVLVVLQLLGTVAPFLRLLSLLALQRRRHTLRLE